MDEKFLRIVDLIEEGYYSPEHYLSMALTLGVRVYLDYSNYKFRSDSPILSCYLDEQLNPVLGSTNPLYNLIIGNKVVDLVFKGVPDISQELPAYTQLGARAIFGLLKFGEFDLKGLNIDISKYIGLWSFDYFERFLEPSGITRKAFLPSDEIRDSISHAIRTGAYNAECFFRFIDGLSDSEFDETGSRQSKCLSLKMEERETLERLYVRSDDFEAYEELRNLFGVFVSNGRVLWRTTGPEGKRPNKEKRVSSGEDNLENFALIISALKKILGTKETFAIKGETPEGIKELTAELISRVTNTFPERFKFKNPKKSSLNKLALHKALCEQGLGMSHDTFYRTLNRIEKDFLEISF